MIPVRRHVRRLAFNDSTMYRIDSGLYRRANDRPTQKGEVMATVLVKRWRYPRGPFRKARFFEFRSEVAAANFIRRERNAARKGGDYSSEFVLLRKKKRRLGLGKK